MNTTQNNSDQCRQARGRMQPMPQFYIYEDLNLICNRVFNKDQITIGSSQEADLYLDHHSVADIHAQVDIKDDQVFLTNNFPQNGLRLNGRAVGLAELQHEDIIDIGPFSLKIKMTAVEPQIPVEEENNFAVRLVNRYRSPKVMQSAAVQLAKMLRTEPDKVLPLISKKYYVLKKGLTGFKAAQIQNALLRAGVLCDVQVVDTAEASPQQPVIETPKATPKPAPMEAPKSTPVEVSQPAPAKAPKSVAAQVSTQARVETPKSLSVEASQPVEAPQWIETSHSLKTSQPAAKPSSSAAPILPPSELAFFDEDSSEAAGDISKRQPDNATIEVSFTEIYEDELDDEEDEIWEAPFQLKNQLGAWHQERGARQSSDHEQLQVVKTIGRSVIDVRVLKGRQKYQIDTDQGRIRLVDVKPRGESYVSILPTFRGYIQTPSGETTADLDSYKTSEYLNRKKSSVYQIPLPKKGTMVVEADGTRYQISSVQHHPTPQVATIKRPSEFSWRHWATSAGVHFFLVICLVVYTFFQAEPPKMEKPHFVKIDPALLQKPEVPKPKPKPKEPPPKPEPVKVAEKKVKPPKKKPVKQKTKPVRTAKKRTSKKKVARSGPVSRHPKAGGGFGEGNIKNRNINQTGLLSVLGSSSIGGPSQAIASVTNLDAVPVPGATERNFSVGGVKGALGNGKISVASGGAIMQTKGSKQVLRSAGARGSGHVAALERGTTGKKKVQGMVTAKMTRTVKIEGGMSRAMVKQVIDQHLEEITYCYEAALMSNPSILGRIVFEWKILMDGRVGGIRIVASNVNSHEIHNCIKSAIKSWQFPKPKGTEVVVSYPFVFDLVSF
jgi:outer membrane biosynthesis protein TonB